MNNDFYILLAFVLYIILMLVIGFYYVKKTSSTSDYFLGGRGLNSYVAALSAQASDMSGWLLMGLPGSIYAFGTNQIWIAVGLFLGTVFNWCFVAKRLRRYSITAGNALTIPAYLQNRFKSKNKVILFSSSVVILIFFLVYTASAFTSGAKLFASVFALPYEIALTIGALVIISYTFLGGFLAVSMTDFIQGMLMLIAVLTIPIIAYSMLGSSETVLNNLYLSKVSNNYFSMTNGVGIKEIISQLSWGLGYMGMPHILVRFMALRSEKEVDKSKVIAIIWVLISLFFAALVGIIGRAYLFNDYGVLGDSETVFITMIKDIFTIKLALPFVGGIFLSACLAAIMSTADSQLLVAASSFSEDIYKNLFKKKPKNDLLISKLCVLVIALFAYIIALNPNNSVMALVSDAWAGLGAAFGPAIMMSLYWKKMNEKGAIAGIVSGAVTVIVWDYIPLINSLTLANYTGLYSLLIGFVVSLLFIVIISKITKPVSSAVLEEFELVNK